MLEKSSRNINELVNNYTNHHQVYPTLSDLFYLLNKIIDSDKTTAFLQVTPFYVNEKLDFQEEFDIAHLYIECRDDVSLEEKISFAQRNMFWLEPNSDYKILKKYVNLKDMQQSHFVIHSDDITGFQNSIRVYMKFLIDTGIPQMMKWLRDTTGLVDEDLPFGNFCFEVISM